MSTDDDVRGVLSLSGAVHWSDGTALDAGLAAGAGGPVLVVPTGAAYENPERLVDEARAHFAAFDTSVEAAMVLRRSDAEDKELAARVRRAAFVYLCGGSPLHIRSVLKDSLVLDAIIGAWRDGATVAGQGGGSVVLSDPMVDPHGGAFTVGLGLVRNLAVAPRGEPVADSGLRRTIALLPAGCALVELPRDAAVLRDEGGAWRALGAPEVYFDRRPAGLEALAGKSVW